MSFTTLLCCEVFYVVCKESFVCCVKMLMNMNVDDFEGKSMNVLSLLCCDIINLEMFYILWLATMFCGNKSFVNCQFCVRSTTEFVYHFCE
jgi:hypothetical protein